MAWLTKSRFLSGLQCHKRLWFEIHEPNEESFEPGIPVLQGRAFDEVVQELQPGVVISRAAGLPAAIAETKRVLGRTTNPASTLYQPTFKAGDLAVVVDVLRRRGAEFDLTEVKATTQVKETHLADAAFQVLVLQRAKIPVGRVFLGLVNNQFVLRRVGDYEGLLMERTSRMPSGGIYRRPRCGPWSFRRSWRALRCQPSTLGRIARVRMSVRSSRAVRRDRRLRNFRWKCCRAVGTSRKH
ncbi:MAG: hypothetical protein QOE55_5058 [Acidobacteriaceae bacterium]|nr:hypothetical protein [Acidobacteriaceae bacterium]